MTSARRWALPACIRRRTLDDSDRAYAPDGASYADALHGCGTANSEDSMRWLSHGFPPPPGLFVRACSTSQVNSAMKKRRRSGRRRSDRHLLLLGPLVRARRGWHVHSPPAMTLAEALESTRLSRVAGRTGDHCIPAVLGADVQSTCMAPVDRQCATKLPGERCRVPCSAPFALGHGRFSQ